MKEATVISLSPRTLVYRPNGPLDVTRVVDLRDVISTDPGPGTEVVIDLSGVTTFDAYGLAGLVHAMRRIWCSGRPVRIIDASPNLAAMLALTAIHRLVSVEVAGTTTGGRAA